MHTPFSALNNGFGQDFDEYARVLLNAAIDADIAAIGLTDYFMLDGYIEMNKLLADEQRLANFLDDDRIEAARMITFFPNLELRSSVVVADDGTAGRINFHLIFDPSLSPTDIEEHFLRETRFTAVSNPDSADDRWSLTRQNLSDLGARLKSEHSEFASESDLVVGMSNAVIAHEEVTATFDRQPSRFADRYLFVVAADEDLPELPWNSQAHQTRKLFIQKSHMLFSANAGTRDFGLGLRHSSVEEFEAEFRGRKPCIHGSGAHKPEDLFNPDLKRQLWVKADPTFQGLRQLLFEPDSRVYIGSEPTALSKERERATRFMESVSFERTPKATKDAEWFHGMIPLNHGLIAIIGTKGSGKSALSDILALLGDTRNTDFSFLTPARFLSPRSGLGEMFSAEVQWLSGQERQRELAGGVDSNAPELVKYIPQGFLEEICTELRESHETKFDHELMDVIFSHVGDAERLGQDSLPDLIEYLTGETEDLVEQLKLTLADINNSILELGAQTTDDHRKSLEGQLAQRQADLKAHMAAKPPEVKEPSADPAELEKSTAIKVELEAGVQAIDELDKKIAETNEGLRVAALQVASADRLSDRIGNLERQLETFHAESAGDAEILGAPHLVRRGPGRRRAIGRVSSITRLGASVERPR